MKLKSLLSFCLVALLLVSNSVFAQNLSFTNEDYKKALWITTRFYGAQRSGDGPNWLLCYHEQKGNINPEAAYKGGKSFIKDADGSYDLTGGWFDCGDHVKFGQTEFFAAYMLILGYSEFPEGYDDYYSFDYEGYRAANDYTWAGKKGKPNGIPDILDEVKYATDYFQKCIRDKSTFYYQVGDGDADHKNWVTSSHMSTLSKNDGGESDGARVFNKATGNVTSMASFCGATLAAMARLYKPFDPAYAQSCLEKALVCYEFVNGTTKGNTGGGSFYGAKPKYEPDMAVFFAELYRTTGETKYLTAAESAATYITNDSGWNHNWSIGYNNTEDLGFYLMAITNSKLAATAKSRLEYYVNTLYKPTSGYLLNVKNDKWGILRYPANQSFIYALYDKLNGQEKTINPYVATSIDHILGKNSRNFSFVVGFAPSGCTHPKYPHHRNYYGNNQNLQNGQGCPLPTGLEFGFLCGAQSFDPAEYPDATIPYEASEGGIDYNAGLVGALGYINSIQNPVNTNKFGHPTPDLGDPQSLCGTGSVTLTATVDLSNLADDETVTYKWYRGTSATPFEQGDAKTSITVTTADTYHCDLVEKSGAWTTRASVEVSAVLPDVDLGEDVVLCTETSKILDAGVNGAGITYTWKKDTETIAGATAQSYTAYTAGTYSVTIAASGCASKSDEIEITSNLPLVQYDTICEPGTANLAVLSAGSYDWYDVLTEGTKLASGATYSPAITANTIYYVQDAGKIDITTGPKPTTFTGTASQWGEIGAKFTTTSALSITGFTALPNGIYNTDPVKIVVDLMKGATKVATYTSKTETNKGNGVITNYTFTFDPPIEISEPGDYTLIPTNGGISAQFYQNGPAYSTYSSSVITFTGATNGTAANNPFPAMFDWKIAAGSSCARTPVLAVIDPTAEKCATPADTEAPTKPGALVFNNIEETEFEVSWTASTDNVGVTGYEVLIDGVLHEKVTTGISIIIDGLTADTEYEISVIAYDEAGNKSTASTRTVTTSFVDRDAPTTPGTLLFSNIEETEFEVSWEASTDNVGVTGYEVWIDGVLHEKVTVGTSIIIDGLTADTEYEISVIAYDEAGNKSTASTGTVTTSEAIDSELPTTPSSVTISDLEDTQFTVSWTASTDNVGVAGYEVWIDGALHETVTTGTSLEIDAWWNADEETTITVTIRAFDEAGNYSAHSSEQDKTFEAINPTLTQTIALAAGWNLISIYVVPENAAIEDIFASIMTEIDIIKNADGFYKPGTPAPLQSLTEMQAGYGYLVKAKTATTLTIEGKIAENVSLSLKPGWNMIGYPYAQPQATTDVLSSIWNNTETIKNFDGFLDKTSGTLNTMNAGKGYYIFVENAGTLDF